MIHTMKRNFTDRQYLLSTLYSTLPGHFFGTAGIFLLSFAGWMFTFIGLYGIGVRSKSTYLIAMAVVVAVAIPIYFVTRLLLNKIDDAKTAKFMALSNELESNAKNAGINFADSQLLDLLRGKDVMLSSGDSESIYRLNSDKTELLSIATEARSMGITVAVA